MYKITLHFSGNLEDAEVLMVRVNGSLHKAFARGQWYRIERYTKPMVDAPEIMEQGWYVYDDKDVPVPAGTGYSGPLFGFRTINQAVKAAWLRELNKTGLTEAEKAFHAEKERRGDARKERIYRESRAKGWTDRQMSEYWFSEYAWELDVHRDEIDCTCKDCVQAGCQLTLPKFTPVGLKPKTSRPVEKTPAFGRRSVVDKETGEITQVRVYA